MPIGPQTQPTAAGETDGGYPGWISVERADGSFGWNPPGTIGGTVVSSLVVPVSDNPELNNNAYVASTVATTTLATEIDGKTDTATTTALDTRVGTAETKLSGASNDPELNDANVLATTAATAVLAGEIDTVAAAAAVGIAGSSTTEPLIYGSHEGHSYLAVVASDFTSSERLLPLTDLALEGRVQLMNLAGSVYHHPAIAHLYQTGQRVRVTPGGLVWVLDEGSTVVQRQTNPTSLTGDTTKWLQV